MTHIDRIHEIQKSLQSWIKEDSHKRACIVKDAETSVYVPNDHIATLLKAFNVMRQMLIGEVCTRLEHEHTMRDNIFMAKHSVDGEFEKRMETPNDLS